MPDQTAGEEGGTSRDGTHAGRTVVVTGGTKGIGAAVARELLAAGAQVVVCGRSEVPELPSAGGRVATFRPCDVREPAQVDALVDAVVADHGRLDVVVHCAGGTPPSDAATASPRFAERIVSLNLLAGLWVAQAANRVMRAQDEGGVIVMIGSVSGVRPSPGTSVYGAAKAGLHHLAASLAIEWAPKVRVVTVTPNHVRTDLSDEHFGGPQFVQAITDTIPLRRMAAPEDVARAVAWVSSDAASYMTGSMLVLHGGDEWPAWMAAAPPEAYPPQNRPGDRGLPGK